MTSAVGYLGVENQLNLDEGFVLYSDLDTLVTAVALGTAAGTNQDQLILTGIAQVEGTTDFAGVSGVFVAVRMYETHRTQPSRNPVGVAR